MHAKDFVIVLLCFVQDLLRQFSFVNSCYNASGGK